MEPRAPGTNFDDRPRPVSALCEAADAWVGMPELPLAIRYFAGAGASHMKKYGTPLEAFAKVRAKASRHAVNNPLAVLKRELSTEEVLESAALWPGVMTRLMACPPTCGGAAAVLMSGEVTKAEGVRSDRYLAPQAMSTDR